MCEKKHYLYLDILKTIAIVFVCIYHQTNISHINSNISILNLDRFIYNIAMIGVPIFFFVNGALLLNSELDIKKHVKKTFKMVGVFWIWRIITFFIIGFYNGIDFLAIGKKEYLNLLMFKKLPEVPFNHFWFIFALIGIYILFPFIKREYDSYVESPKKNYYLLVFIGILSVLIFIPSVVNGLSKIDPIFNGITMSNISDFSPFSSLFGSMLIYFILGGLLHRKLISIKNQKRLLIFSGIAIIIGLFLAYLSWAMNFNIDSQFDAVFSGYTTLPCMIITISFIILVFILSRYIKKSIYLFETIGRNTLFVYYVHWIVGKTFFIPFLYDIPVKGRLGDIIQIILIFLMIIILSLIAKILIKIPIINKLIK